MLLTDIRQIFIFGQGTRGFKEKSDFMYYGEHNADNVRLHGKFEPRFYKPDGSFIES